MKQPYISVLLCVFNPIYDELYRAVQSIIDQTYENWEMILYDDGSEETYIPLIENIAQMDNRIIYTRNVEHHSLAYGLNYSLNMAQGQYIARMDGDDMSHRDRFQRMVEFLENNHEYGWIGCNTILMNETDEIIGRRSFPCKPEGYDFLAFSPYVHPSIIFRAAMLKEEGGYCVSSTTIRGEDYELFMRLHAKGLRGYNLQEELLYYREKESKYSKRKLKFQLDEIYIRFQGFRLLEIMSIKTLYYVMKPLLVYITPRKCIKFLKDKRMKKHEECR